MPGGRLPLCVGGIWSLAQALQSACTPYLMSAFGWESPFYIYPLLVALWARLWMRFGVGIDPKSTPRCSAKEAEYLCGETGSDSAGVVGAGAAEEEAERKFGLKVYLAVLRQPVVLGPMCLSTWCASTLTTILL